MTYLYLVLAFALAVSAAPNSEPWTPLRPNFVVIFLDDAGWGDVGFNVGDQITPETNVLDKLAREGLRFTDFHAAASVCTPSRASLLTGRLGLRTGVTKNFREGALGGLPTTEMTIAELLRDHAGYQTAMLGKWHLGTHPPYHPSYRGFNRYFGVPYSVDMGCTDVGIDHPPRLPCCRSGGSKGSSGRQNLHHPHRRLMTIPDTVDQVVMSGAHFFDPSSVVGTRGPTCEEAPGVPLYNSTGAHCSGKPSCNNDILEQPVNLTSLSGRYGDFAVNFLEEMAREQPGNNTSERPFFLYIAMSHMHVPLAYDARFEEASPRTDRKIYGNALAEVDFEISRVVDTLQRLGLANDTLVFITSDNGPWDMKCHLSGLKGPYEGKYLSKHFGTGSGKFTTWEGGHRVPALVYWPSHVPPSGVTNVLTSTLDIFPTFASLAGVSLPTNRSFDGVDLSSLITDQCPSDLPTRETLFHPDQFGELSAMRLGKYKVHFRITQAPPCIPGDERDIDDILKKWAFVVGGDSETKGWLDVPLVFDLENDLQEENPLFVTESDAAMLKDLWQHKMTDISSDRRSKADYSQQDDPAGWPCCGKQSEACLCPL